MNHPTRKLSEIMKEMSEHLLRQPDAAHSSEAAHVALMFANIAWNECVGLAPSREGYRSAWKSIESENPRMWSEFKATDVNAMIDELVEYKNKHHPDDQRRILLCGIPNSSIHVEWLPPAKPGVDSEWEMALYGMVRTGEHEQAVKFLKQTRGMTPKTAKEKVVAVAAELGMTIETKAKRKRTMRPAMGNEATTGRKLLNKLSKSTASVKPSSSQRGEADMPSIEDFIKDGHDPIFSVYAFVQNITSFFSESVSQLPEMKKFAKIVSKAEDEYLPSGPPMSPLTTSFFTTWAFYDLRFDGTDTLASCLIEASDAMRMNADQRDGLKKLASSRMGIYEHVGMDGPHIRLRELIADAEYTCHSASGYRGRLGELWYVRLLPPLVPDLASYHIAFTTPYILIQASKDDWMQFLRRGMSQSRIGNDSDRLYQFLKYGPAPNYWNEFVFKGYHNHQSDAIFLAGIPDLKATLPHA